MAHQQVKPLQGSGNLLPEGVADELNGHIATAVTQLVQYVPAHSRGQIAPIIGKLAARVLETYKNHAALHGGL